MAAKALANPANDTGLDNVYYDGQMTCYRVADWVSDTATWYPRAVDCRAPYRDYWYIGLGGGQGYRIFPQGLAEDWLRNANASSKTQVNAMATTGYGADSGTGVYGEPYLAGEHGSREAAYALMAHLENIRCGVAANTARIATLYGYCKGHVDAWAANSYTYTRPFMAALTSKALIQYYEQYAANVEIKTKLTALWEYIYTNMWGAAESNGSLSFKYTNVNTATLSANYTNSGGTISNPAYNSGSTEASCDLNLLIVPPFGWLYSVTGSEIWRTRGDLIFDEGISVYSGGFQVRGAYLGPENNTGVIGKHVNQNFWWSDRYLTWTANTSPSTGTNTGASSRNRIISPQGGYYGGAAAVATSFDPATYFSGATTQFDIDGNNTAKILDASDAAITNATKVKTLNSTAGAVSWVQATVANQGTWNSGVSNSKGALTLTGSPMTYPASGTTAQSICQNTTKWWCFVVWNPVSTTANAMFLRCYDNSYSYNRVRIFLAAAAVAIEGQKADNTATTTLTSASNVTTGTPNAALWEWDVAAGTATITLNNAATSVNGSAFAGGAGTIANTTSGSQEILTTTDGKLFRMTVGSGALSSDRSGLFAAAKTYYGITVY